MHRRFVERRRHVEIRGLAVVVENGSDEAKAYADVIAPPSDRDAVAWVLENLVD